MCHLFIVGVIFYSKRIVRKIVVRKIVRGEHCILFYMGRSIFWATCSLPLLEKEKKKIFIIIFFTKYVEYGIIKIVIVRRNLRL